jgi:hypothetical protein
MLGPVRSLIGVAVALLVRSEAVRIGGSAKLWTVGGELSIGRTPLALPFRDTLLVELTRP